MADAIANYVMTGGANLLRQDAYNRMGLADFVRRVKSGDIKPTQVDATGRVAGGAKRGLDKKAKKAKKGKKKPVRAVATQPATAGRRQGRIPFGGGMGGGMSMPMMPYQMSNPMLQRAGFSVIQSTPQRDVSAEHQIAKVLQTTQEIASAVQKPSPALQDLGKIKVNPMAETKAHSGTVSMLTQRLTAPPAEKYYASEPYVSEPEEPMMMLTPPSTAPEGMITEMKKRGRKTDAQKAYELGMTKEEYKAIKPKPVRRKATVEAGMPTESDVELAQYLNQPLTVSPAPVGGAKRGYNKGCGCGGKSRPASKK